MRDITLAEEAALEAAHRRTYRKLEIQDAEGDWIDFTQLIHSIGWGTDVEKTVIEMRLSLRRTPSGGFSISPLVSDAIDPGRGIRFSTATVVAGSAAPDPGDYHLVFEGEVDAIDPAQDPVPILARDSIGALLADRDIESEDTIASTGISLEAAIQVILDDWADGIVLDVPVATGITLDAPDIKLEKTKVLDAVRTLAQRIGWTLRPKWNEAAGEFRLTLYEPPRSTTTSLWTFPRSRYFSPQRLDVNRADIVNAVTLNYRNASTGLRVDYPGSAPSSIAAYGRHWYESKEADSSPVNSPTRAAAFVTALLSDMSTPYADMQVDVLYHWPADVDDYYTFEANVRHFSSEQKMAVVGYWHELTQGKRRTTLTVRGKPTGGRWRWFLPRFGGVYKPAITGIQIGFTVGGHIVASVIATENATDIYVTADVDDEPADPDSGDSHITGSFGSVDTGVTCPEGGVAIVKAIARNSSGTYSIVKRVELLRTEGSAVLRAPIVNLRVSQSGSTGIAVLTVYDPDHLVAIVFFDRKIGAAAWEDDLTSWDASSGSPGVNDTLVRTAYIDIDPEHNSSINCFVSHALDGGVPEQKGHTFDIDTIAKILSCGIDFDPDTGEVIIEPRADEDTADIYALVGDGSDPGTPDSGDLHVAGNEGRLATGVFVDPGDEAYVRLVGRNAASEYGPVPEAFRRINPGSGSGGGGATSDVMTQSIGPIAYVSTFLRVPWAFSVTLESGHYAVGYMIEAYDDGFGNEVESEIPLSGTSGTHVTGYYKDPPGRTVAFSLEVRIFNSSDVLVRNTGGTKPVYGYQLEGFS